jgi:EAL domain-containing protein (putative c-di-GMP-specific phosphodiesterase class I)
MLADFQPDILKIDMALTRAIATDSVRSKIVAAIVMLCQSLHVSVVAEGIETLQEAVALRHLGVRLFQGYFFARPGLEKLPIVPMDRIDSVRRAHESLLLDPASAGEQGAGELRYAHVIG